MIFAQTQTTKISNSPSTSSPSTSSPSLKTSLYIPPSLDHNLQVRVSTLLNLIGEAESFDFTLSLQLINDLSKFFMTKPYACEPSSPPQYPPIKEMGAKLQDEEARRLRAAGGKINGDGAKKTLPRVRAVRAIPTPQASAELQVNLDRQHLITHANAKSKSGKFPPPHQD